MRIHPFKYIRPCRSTILLAVLIIFGSLVSTSSIKSASVSAQNEDVPICKTGSILPTVFIPNHGEHEKRVRFYARPKSGAVFITRSGEIVSVFPRIEEGRISGGLALKESFVDGTTRKIQGIRESETMINRFKGSDASNWQSNLPGYSALDFGKIYDGISLTLQVTTASCEKVFTVEPGADPEAIKISVEGAETLSISDDGELECNTEYGKVCFTKPVAYQDINGERIDVAANYVVQGETYGFTINHYDHQYPVVIDPLIASTFWGGSYNEVCNSLYVTNDGSVYVAGHTTSLDFPTVTGAFNESHSGGDWDIFISLLDSTLSSLISSTYIGGNDDEWFHNNTGMVQLSNGNIYISVQSYSLDFPTTTGAYDRSQNGMLDSVVFVLDSSLTNLISSTFLGGSNDDGGGPIAIDENGNVYIAGVTWGIDSDFPTTKGAYDRTHNDSWDVFVSKFDSDLSTLMASTLLGGYSIDHARCLLCDNTGGVYLAGVTTSSDFPTTAGAYDETFNSTIYLDYDICISLFENDLTSLRASTFLGGGGDDVCSEIIFDLNGDIVLTGDSYSVGYPTTPGVINEELNRSRDIVISRMGKDLDTLLTSTYFGAEGADRGRALFQDHTGHIFVTGGTTSTEYFPTTPGAYDRSTNFDLEDGFIIRIDEAFQRFTAGTILGGYDEGNRRNEICKDIEVSENSRVYVCGQTISTDFPTTEGAIFEEKQGGDDGFISILDELLTLHAGKLVIGPGSAHANPPLVRVYPVAQDAVHGFEFSAYGFTHYGVNVYCGNLDDDEADEILTGAGAGEIYGPHVRGFEIDGTPLPGLSFLAYGTNRWGVNIAAGDIDDDDFNEIITGAGPGSVFGPHVRAFDYDGTTGVNPVPGVSYFAYGTPKWGVNVTAGDIDGDGYDEIITGAGPGSMYGPHVRGWNVDGSPATAIPGVNFLAYGTNKFGVVVGSGDLDGDGIDEIVTGAGPGQTFGAHVRGWNYDGTVLVSISGINFFAWPPGEARYGASVYAGADLDSDGRDELVVGTGPDPSVLTPVKVFRYDGEQVTEWFSLEAFQGLKHGTSVVAGRF